MAVTKVFFYKQWSPWVAGGLVGVLAAVCCVFAQKTLGVSGGFLNIDSFIGKEFHLPWYDLPYFRAVRQPKVTFQVMQYVGMVFGALAASLLSGDFRIRLLPDREWRENFGGSLVKRWVVIFIGGALVEFGACIAGGCTSGLGISGIIQLSPAGFVFFAAAFIGGIAATMLIFRRR